MSILKNIGIGFEATIIDWCKEMKIKKYDIGKDLEINVQEDVDLSCKEFTEIPYKFGVVTGCFYCSECPNLKSLKNCPKKVGGYFVCDSKFSKKYIKIIINTKFIKQINYGI